MSRRMCPFGCSPFLLRCALSDAPAPCFLLHCVFLLFPLAVGCALSDAPRSVQVCPSRCTLPMSPPALRHFHLGDLPGRAAATMDDDFVISIMSLSNQYHNHAVIIINHALPLSVPSSQTPLDSQCRLPAGQVGTAARLSLRAPRPSPSALLHQAGKNNGRTICSKDMSVHRTQGLQRYRGTSNYLHEHKILRPQQR